MITVKRKAICKVLYNVTPTSPILLPYSKEEMIELFFDEKEDKEGIKYYEINSIMLGVIRKIDCINLPFDNVRLSHLNLQGTHNIRFNPQNIYQKDLSQTELDESSQIIGNDDMNQKDLFEGVKITSTHFNGCKNARINPQTVFEKDFSHTSLEGVDFTSFSFDGCQLWDTNFRGSIGVKFNPNKVRNFSNINSLEDVELLDMPEEDTNYRCPNAKNHDDLHNKMIKLQIEFKELIKDQLPEEEKEEPKPVQTETPKQKRKWFGN